MTQRDLDLPPTGAELPLETAVSCCEYCHASLYRHEDVLVVTKHFSAFTAQLHFCGEECANTYYLEHLRSGL